MKAAIMKRLHQLEQRTKAVAGTSPSLIKISYEEIKGKWVVGEIFDNGSRKEVDVERLQDYCFKPSFDGWLILDTFASPDPTIFQNLFCLDVADLRKDAGASENDGIYIQSITEEEKNMCCLVVKRCDA